MAGKKGGIVMGTDSYSRRPKKMTDKNEATMGTNSYSITSKRSVERLYYPDEPSFLRAFVSKVKRRAPLINRGYWLRMKAIERVVWQFLDGEDTEATVSKSRMTAKKKVIVNLGCGEDTLPFRTLWQRQQDLQRDEDEIFTRNERDNLVFIDVDYPQLMKNKAAKITETSALGGVIGVRYVPTSRFFDDDSDSPSILLRTPTYIAIGADLSNPDHLTPLLHSAIGLESCTDPTNLDILFIAEVSITYMPTPAADSVIACACTVFPAARSQFCLLEQFLPAGAMHPFAQMMLQHFEKSAPLQNVETYPTLNSQAQRFMDLGWKSVATRSLWDLWQDDSFLSSEDRQLASSREMFDEWEEFALFASHYFLLIASSHNFAPLPGGNYRFFRNCDHISPSASLYKSHTPAHARRFASIAKFGSSTVLPIGGCYLRGKTRDIYTTTTGTTIPDISCSRDTPEPILCHTLTQLHGNHILVGGRESPGKAHTCCWLLEKRTEQSTTNDPEVREWRHMSDLPCERYRHCAVPINIPSWEVQGILVFGGRDSDGFGNALTKWTFWDKSRNEWLAVDIEFPNNQPCARFSASMCIRRSSFDGNENQNGLVGWLVGGINSEGTVCEDSWEWRLRVTDSRKLTLTFTERSSNLKGAIPVVFRFGASIVSSPFSDGILLIGGVGKNGVLQADEDIVHIDGNLQVSKVHVDGWTKERPLLVGHSAVVTDEKEVLLLCGGAVCFSFGSYWNNHMTILHANGNSQDNRPTWRLVDPSVSEKPQRVESGNIPAVGQLRSDSLNGEDPSDVVANGTVKCGFMPDAVPPVRSMREISAVDFRALLASPEPHPVVIFSQDIGLCTTWWTPSDLISEIGEDRKVVIHSASSASLNFKAKNFKYVTVPFQEFITDAVKGGHVYMRALAADEPARKPADLERDFPDIAVDFHVPSGMREVLEEGESGRIHSSVLRIAGDIEMWLHYDVMANVLCQVRGKKRVVLFPPSDVLRLGFKAGETTSEIDVFGPEGVLSDWKQSGVQPQEVVLEKGDVLFIPACWSHATASGDKCTEGDAGEDGRMNVAVNVFFRSLEAGYAAGKDVYGNRDLQMYEDSRRDVRRIKASLATVDDVERKAAADKLSRLLLGSLSADEVRTTVATTTSSEVKVKIKDTTIEAERIRQKGASLPEQLKKFYLERLAAELIDL